MSRSEKHQCWFAVCFIYFSCLEAKTCKVFACVSLCVFVCVRKICHGPENRFEWISQIVIIGCTTGINPFKMTTTAKQFYQTQQCNFISVKDIELNFDLSGAESHLENELPNLFMPWPPNVIGFWGPRLQSHKRCCKICKETSPFRMLFFHFYVFSHHYIGLAY